MYVQDKYNDGCKYNKLAIIKAVCFSLLVIAGLLIFQLAIMVVCESVSLAVLKESIADNDNATAIVSILYGLFSSIIAIVIYRIIADKKITDKMNAQGNERLNRESIDIYRVAVLFLFGIVIQWLMFSFLNFVFVFFKDSAIFVEYGKMMESLGGNKTALIYIYSLFLAPVSEEYVFRGVIYSYMRKYAPVKVANFVQAAMFGLFHMNLIQGVYAFAGGLIFGYVAEHKKSMLECVLVHMIVNITGTFVFPVMFTIFENVINPVVLYGVSGLVSVVILTVFIKMKLLRNDKIEVESL